MQNGNGALILIVFVEIYIPCSQATTTETTITAIDTQLVSNPNIKQGKCDK